MGYFSTITSGVRQNSTDATATVTLGTNGTTRQLLLGSNMIVVPFTPFHFDKKTTKLPPTDNRRKDSSKNYNAYAN